MKSWKYLLIGFWITQACIGQQLSDQSILAIDVSDAAQVHLYNIYGQVTISTTDGNVAKLTVNRRIEANSNQLLEQMSEQIYLDTMWIEKNLYFFLQVPDRRLELVKNGLGHYTSCYTKHDYIPWLYKDDVTYQFTLNLELPAKMNLIVSTHEGEMEVTGMAGEVRARNHHDNIQMSEIGGNTFAYTHHGNIDIAYSSIPSQEGSYKTHHGDIRLSYPTVPSCDFALRSRHGAFYTDFDWELLPARLAEASVTQGTQYVIKGAGDTQIRIGDGGALQSCKTYHGDIFINKQ